MSTWADALEYVQALADLMPNAKRVDARRALEIAVHEYGIPVRLIGVDEDPYGDGDTAKDDLIEAAISKAVLV